MLKLYRQYLIEGAVNQSVRTHAWQQPNMDLRAWQCKDAELSYGPVRATPC